MVKEGVTYCIRIRRYRLRELNSALIEAGYKRHILPRFEKAEEIGTWCKEIKNKRWVHVQVVDEDSFLEIFAHTEPSPNYKPLNHIRGVITGKGVNFSAGSRKLRGDLKSVGFNFT